jgi:hypothetical protein
MAPLTPDLKMVQSVASIADQEVAREFRAVTLPAWREPGDKGEYDRQQR